MNKETEPTFHNNILPETSPFNSITPEQLEKMLLDAGIDIRLDNPYVVLQPNATREEMENVKEAVGQLYYDASDGFKFKARKIEHERNTTEASRRD